MLLLETRKYPEESVHLYFDGLSYLAVMCRVFQMQVNRDESVPACPHVL